MRALAVVLLVSGCSTPIVPTQDATNAPTPSAGPAPPVPSPAPTPVASAPADLGARGFEPREKPEDPAKLMAPFELDSQKPARRTLYSWTTREQAAQVAKSKKLLLKAATDAGVVAPFEERLRHPSGAPLAQRLMMAMSRPPLDKHRYAFTNPIGWSVGVAGKPYGPVLIRITLREDAILLTLDNLIEQDMQPMRAMRVNGVPVAAREVEQHPEQVAAVFHQTFDSNGVPFREYIVVNESMVESWAIGTPEVQQEIDRARDAIRRLLKVTPEQDPIDGAELFRIWYGDGKTAPHAAWSSVLGVGAPPYAWTRANLGAVLAHLDGAEQPAPLEHRPTGMVQVRLPPAPPAPPPPPKNKRIYIE